MFFAAIDVEEVIDHLHADMATLGTCSLVSRAWVRPCRYHMFRELYLQRDTAKALLELLDSEDDNYIAPFIHQLSFYNCVQEYSLDPFSDLFYVLYDCATALKSLSFTRYRLITDDLKDYFPLGRITELDITKCIFESFDELINLFTALPLLEHLIVDRLTFGGQFKLPPNHRTVLLSKLRSIEIWTFMVPIILPLLIPVPALRKANFNIYDGSELAIIGEFLGETGPHLNDFSLFRCSDMTKNIGAVMLLSCKNQLI
jgi:hypothetical protein